MSIPPESMVLGTAIKRGSGTFISLRAFWVEEDWGMPSRHMANEQKFRVLTVSECSSHGCLVETATASTGRVLSSEASSAMPSCHTSSLSSLP